MRLCRNRQPDCEYSSRAIGSVAGDDRPVHGLNKAPRNRQSQTSARTHVVCLPGSIELVEDMLKVVGGIPALVSTIKPTESVSQLWMRTVVPGGAYLAVSEVE